MRFGKFALVTGFLGCVAFAQPRPFLDTFGPNNATRPDAVGFGRVPGGAIHTAETYFRPDRDLTLTGIEMGVQLREGANELIVSLHEENPSTQRPANTAIESFALSGAMQRRTTGYGVVRIDSIQRPLLRAGTRYWIRAQAPGSDTFAGWGLNNVGDVNPVPVPRGITATNPRPAMRLWGEFTGGQLLQAVHTGRLGAGLAKDTWISLFGEGLSESTRAWSEADFVDGRVPTELDGVRVLIDGEPAALSYVSPGQINALVLNDSVEQTSTVEVTVAGESTNALQVRRYAAAPGAFGLPGSNEVAAIHADGTIVGQSNSTRSVQRLAQPGDVIAIFATGLGVTLPVADASLVSQPPVPVEQDVEVQLNNQPAQVLYAGRVGPGLFQINIRIPADTPRGTPLTVRIVVSGSAPLMPLLPSTDPTLTIP